MTCAACTAALLLPSDDILEQLAKAMARALKQKRGAEHIEVKSLGAALLLADDDDTNIAETNTAAQFLLHSPFDTPTEELRFDSKYPDPSIPSKGTSISDMPPEILDKILEFVFSPSSDNSKPVVLQSGKQRHFSRTLYEKDSVTCKCHFSDTSPSPLNTQILLTCRAFYHIGTPIFYSTHTFHFQDLSSLNTFIRFSPPTITSNMKHIIVDTAWDEHLRGGFNTWWKDQASLRPILKETSAKLQERLLRKLEKLVSLTVRVSCLPFDQDGEEREWASFRNALKGIVRRWAGEREGVLRFEFMRRR